MTLGLCDAKGTFSHLPSPSFDWSLPSRRRRLHDVCPNPLLSCSKHKKHRLSIVDTQKSITFKNTNEEKKRIQFAITSFFYKQILRTISCDMYIFTSKVST